MHVYMREGLSCCSLFTQQIVDLLVICYTAASLELVMCSL